jgi:hypothetical protein
MGLATALVAAEHVKGLPSMMSLAAVNRCCYPFRPTLLHEPSLPMMLQTTWSPAGHQNTFSTCNTEYYQN